MIGELEMGKGEVLICCLEGGKVSVEVKRGYEEKEKMRGIVKLVGREGNERGMM